MVTEGGAFPEGRRVHDAVARLNKFFHYGQRLKQLTLIQQCHSLPDVVPQIDAITRVAYMVKMYRCSILNYYAFKDYFSDGTRCGKSKKEKQAFTCYRDISGDDWTLMIEIEAVLHSCAILLVSHKQIL